MVEAAGDIPELVRQYRKLIRCLYPCEALSVYPKEEARIVVIRNGGKNILWLYGSQTDKNIEVLQRAIEKRSKP